METVRKLKFIPQSPEIFLSTIARNYASKGVQSVKTARYFT